MAEDSELFKVLSKLTPRDREILMSEISKSDKHVIDVGSRVVGRNVTLMESAINGCASSYSVKTMGNYLVSHMNGTRDDVYETILKVLSDKKSIKFYEIVSVKLKKSISKRGSEITTTVAYLRSNAKTILMKDEISKALKDNKRQISDALANFMKEGSGWVQNGVISHTICIVEYRPLYGGCNNPVPEMLSKRYRSIVNIRNDDNECFRWCHVRCINPVAKNSERITKKDKKIASELNYDGIDFPISAKDYSKIEERNKIEINVFGWDESDRRSPVSPIRVSKAPEGYYPKTLDVLLVGEHYILIKNFSMFMTSITKSNSKKYFCKRCFSYFYELKRLDEHKADCIEVNGVQSVKMPVKGRSIVEFKNFDNQVMIPFVIYADFEAITEKTPNENQQYQRHIDCSFAYKVVCCYDDNYSSDIVMHRGPNAALEFLKSVVGVCSELRIVYDRDFPDKPKRNRIIPVIFHNLKGYDSHFIMQYIGEVASDKLKLTVIPNNMEKYLSFSLGNNIRFIDSLQFLSSSLGKLVKNLPDDSFKYVSGELASLTGSRRSHLLKRKGVYPYDYMDSFERFDETELPPKSEFYSKLTDEDISSEDYEHAKSVWSEFNMKTMGDYHDFYLKLDVLQLADVFEEFRRKCMDEYGLDPCHYFSLPGVSWDAMLKYTKVKLELMTDIDMYNFVERGTRGGVSCICKRYSSSNNKYMKEYSKRAKQKYITYLDANNLYGWAMSKPLPTGGHRWLTENEIHELEAKLNINHIDSFNPDARYGMTLEVDLFYPGELHELHDDLPLAPVKRMVMDQELSEFCVKMGEESPNIPTPKLIGDLHPKENYVLHLRNLIQYIKLGMKVVKLRRGIIFNQSEWLKPYIDKNTKLRSQAKNAFEKDFFKLMNNSVFGKTMENLRKRVKISLVHDKKSLLKLVSKPTYRCHKIFTEDLVAVHVMKNPIFLNKPSFVGAAILDISKTLIFDFHYNFIKKTYGKRSKLLFTDTDSLTYEIETDDLYKDLWKHNKEWFDFSDYPKDPENPMSKYHSDENKKVVGMFKDEACGEIITEFVGLRPKMYSYKKDDGSGDMKAKGVKTKNITHDDYVEVLRSGKKKYDEMKVIASKKHQIGSYIINKVSLSCSDNKRFIQDNGVITHAYGNKADMFSKGYDGPIPE